MRLLAVLVSVAAGMAVATSPVMSASKKRVARAYNSNAYQSPGYAPYRAPQRVTVYRDYPAYPAYQPVPPGLFNPFFLPPLPYGVSANDRRREFKGTDPDTRIRTEIRRDYSFFDR